MILRPALLQDVPALAELGRDSFVGAFGHLYSRSDLDAFLSAHKTDAAYREILANPAGRVCVAEMGGALTGFCTLAFPSEFAEHSDAQSPLALQQLYTDPARTGQGIGAALMDWALAEARSLGADAVQLSVWSENLGAQKFYARYGFAKIADIHFMVGSQRDDEFLLELRLANAGG